MLLQIQNVLEQKEIEPLLAKATLAEFADGAVTVECRMRP